MPASNRPTSQPSIRSKIVGSIAFQTAFLLAAALISTVYFASLSTEEEVDANRQVAIEALSTFAQSQLYYFDHAALNGSIRSAVESNMFDKIQLNDRYGLQLISEGEVDKGTEADLSITVRHQNGAELGSLLFWNTPTKFGVRELSPVWYLNLLIVSILFMISVVRSRNQFETVVINPLSDFIRSMKTDPDEIKPARFESEEFIELATGFHELHTALEDEASIDRLTGLYNRRELDRDLQKLVETSKRDGVSFSILFMDADKFKNINDTHGHKTGDKFLRKVGKRLMDIAGSNRTLYRFGGDEFVVIVRDCNKKDAANWAELVHEMFIDPIHVDGLTLETSFSIGIACFPDDGENANVLLTRADMAVYGAKKTGRRRTVTFNADIDDEHKQEVLFERTFKSSLKEEKIYFHKQPIVTLSTLETWGSEALMRVPIPEQDRFVPPNQVVQIASQTGYLTDLTNITLTRADIHLTENDPLLKLCVNFSPEQLMAPSAMQRFLKTAETAGCGIHNIVLEVTEDKLIEQPLLISRLHELAQAGFKIALDDFGSAYSSLACVRLLPLEIIKIDKSLLWAAMEGKRDALLFEAAIGIARTFGCKVVAEGIENQQQLDYVRSLSIEYGQGYFIDDLVADPQPLARSVS